MVLSSFKQIIHFIVQVLGARQLLNPGSTMNAPLKFFKLDFNYKFIHFFVNSEKFKKVSYATSQWIKTSSNKLFLYQIYHKYEYPPFDKMYSSQTGCKDRVLRTAHYKWWGEREREREREREKEREVIDTNASRTSSK